jgi:hypothetical protein
MASESKFVLTIDAKGAVVRVQNLGDDGSFKDVPVQKFFSEITVPSGSFSGSGSLEIQPLIGTQGPNVQFPIVRAPAPPPAREPKRRPPTPKKKT